MGPRTAPDANDDLKSLPVVEVEKRLASSPEGRTQAEAKKTADPIWAERDRRTDGQSVPEIPHLSLGSDPLDDRRGDDSVGSAARGHIRDDIEYGRGLRAGHGALRAPSANRLKRNPHDHRRDGHGRIGENHRWRDAGGRDGVPVPRGRFLHSKENIGMMSRCVPSIGQQQHDARTPGVLAECSEGDARHRAPMAATVAGTGCSRPRPMRTTASASSVSSGSGNPTTPTASRANNAGAPNSDNFGPASQSPGTSEGSANSEARNNRL